MLGCWHKQCCRAVKGFHRLYTSTVAFKAARPSPSVLGGIGTHARATPLNSARPAVAAAPPSSSHPFGVVWESLEQFGECSHTSHLHAPCTSSGGTTPGAARALSRAALPNAVKPKLNCRTRTCQHCASHRPVSLFQLNKSLTRAPYSFILVEICTNAPLKESETRYRSTKRLCWCSFVVLQASV